jgi:TolB-like protein/DNA-binding winged helix-turn-helix (wHTH) protein
MRTAIRVNAVNPSREDAPPVRFAGLVLSLDARTLARDSGEAIRLTRGEFALLRMFVGRPGQVIGRDALLDTFTDRRFESFDRSVDVLIWRLRRKIEPDPKQPRLIVTVPGEGYRFDGLTQSLSPRQKPSIAVPASQDSPDGYDGGRPPLTERPAVPGATDGVKIPMSEHREPPRLSIVVLPFATIGADTEQECFADGVTDSLTTDLSRIGGAFVIGGSTALTYKGKATDVRQIGRELNVRYVLEGSVQRGRDRVRVNVQLLEAETASHIWAERFDKPIADLFDMQDEIVSRLANGLGQELSRAEASRAERAVNPDSMDHYFLGRADMRKGRTVAILDSARLHYDRAIELDQDNVDASVARAWIDLAFVGSWLSEDRRERLLSAEAHINNALKLKPDSANAHCALGALRVFSNRAEQGVAECERALAIDGNLAAAHAHIGMAKLLLGRNEETEAHILEAFRISPRDERAGGWMVIAGAAKFHLSRDEEALERLNRSIELNPNTSFPRFCLAAVLPYLDRVEDAREAARTGLELNPSFTIARFRSQTLSDHPVYLAGRERMYEGLRLAGIPEG